MSTALIKAEAAAEAKLRGPHTFPLERLMGTYWELLYAQGEHQGVCPNTEEHRDALSADVFLQISSLVSLRFLSQVGLTEQHSLHHVPLSQRCLCCFMRK